VWEIIRTTETRKVDCDEGIRGKRGGGEDAAPEDIRVGEAWEELVGCGWKVVIVQAEKEYSWAYKVDE
jgi:hypothetical protein